MRATWLGAALALFHILPAAGQVTATEPPFPRGEVVERVVCLHDSSQTYALFLPSAYRAERPWPILYVFDPGARGRVAAQLFSKAAKRLGYVVAASNNSRNGPSAIASAALEAMWVDSHQRLTIDPRRVYTAGMSGGTGPAVWLATSQGAGIIACAGALQPAHASKVDETFTWLSVVGDADFNLDLNRDLVADLTGRGVAARLVTFDGGHGWPPEDVAARCLEWLELGAMRTGRCPRDPAFIELMQQQGLTRVRALIAQGQLNTAAAENDALARELAGLAPVEALAAEARRLRATPEASRERKREKALSAKCRYEATRLVQLRQTLEQDASGNGWRALDARSGAPVLAEIDDVVGSARGELERALARLARDVAAEERATALVARRVVDGFYIETFFAGQEYRRTARFDAARVDFELCEKMRPTIASPAYELARTHAARGDKKKALAELRRAITRGFSDARRLIEDEEWKDLSGLPEFGAVVEELRARAAR